MTGARPCEHEFDEARCTHGCAWARRQELGPAGQLHGPTMPVADRDLDLPRPDDPTVCVFVRKGDPLPWLPTASVEPTAPAPTAAKRRRRTGSG